MDYFERHSSVRQAPYRSGAGQTHRHISIRPAKPLKTIASCRPALLSGRKVQIIKSLVRMGLYETGEKIKITAKRLLEVL